MLYLGFLRFGNPPQPMRVVFDTGSTNAWILNYKTNVGKQEKCGFEETKSKTCKKCNNEWVDVSFGSGKLGGHFYKDDVRMGEEGTSMVIKDQTFGNVEKQQTIFSENNFDGIIGMAYPPVSHNGYRGLFDNLMR